MSAGISIGEVPNSNLNVVFDHEGEYAEEFRCMSNE